MRALMASCARSIAGVLVPCASAGTSPVATNRTDAKSEVVKNLDFMRVPESSNHLAGVFDMEVPPVVNAWIDAGLMQVCIDHMLFNM
jgi:hypothetical protein